MNKYNCIVASLAALALNLWLTATAVAGPNYALAFNGTSGCVDTGTAVIPTSGDFTVEVWVNLPAAPYTYKEVLSQGSSGNAFYIGTDTGNNLRLGDTCSVTGVPFPVGGWHHLAVVKSSTNTILYVDGTNRASKGSAIANPAAATGLRLGRQYGGWGEYWVGGLDDVRVWNVARNAEQIRTNCCATLTGTEAGLVANWQFSEGRGTHCAAIGASPVTNTLSGGIFWMPLGVVVPTVQLLGANPLTNECHTAFNDPGAVAIAAPTGLAAGALHSLVLKADGTVIAWGAGSTNSSAGSVFNYGQAIVPAAATNVVAIASGECHSLALRLDGTVVAWGFNNLSQITVPATAINVVAIAAGAYHSLALRLDGTVVGWGDYGFGQTTPPANATNVVAIAGGEYHSLALKADGTVVAWGAGLTSNPSDGADFGQSIVPDTATNVVAIAAGFYHSLALKADGTVVAWGRNNDGQATVPAAATNVVAIAGGQFHSLALKADGTVVAWGNNAAGQLSTPSTATNIVAITAGVAFNLALKADGTVIGWNWNNYGQTTIPASVYSLNLPVGVSGAVAVNTPGTYELTYSCTNAFGYVASTRRTVVVWQAGQNPPSLASLALVGGSISFTLSGDSGQTVMVETCTNLAAPVWVPVQTNTLGGSPVNFSAPVEPQSPSRFYRLRTP